MKLITKHLLLSLCIAIISISCGTSEPALVKSETSSEMNSAQQSVTEPDTTRSIAVTINDRVKYELTKIDTAWTGVALQYDTNDPLTRKVVREIPLVPAYGWSDFEDVVRFLMIYTIPDQKEIENHKPAPVSNQSRTYRITVFDGENSRTYYYFNPEGELNEYWESQNVVTFGTYLTSEMKVLEGN
ncbi:MAG: hypothetical protein RIE52_04590 [Balneola sp.]|jgi:hypothetical protein